MRPVQLSAPPSRLPHWARSRCCLVAPLPKRDVPLMSGSGVLKALQSQV